MHLCIFISNYVYIHSFNSYLMHNKWMISFGCGCGAFSHIFQCDKCGDAKRSIAELFKFIIICSYSSLVSTEETIVLAFASLYRCSRRSHPHANHSQPWFLIRLSWCDIKRSIQCTFPLSFSPLAALISTLSAFRYYYKMLLSGLVPDFRTDASKLIIIRCDE